MTRRSILITGCSSGIGLASARVLKARGWRVLATARKAEDLTRLNEEEGVEALQLDLADPLPSPRVLKKRCVAPAASSLRSSITRPSHRSARLRI